MILYVKISGYGFSYVKLRGFLYILIFTYPVQHIEKLLGIQV